jgi:hypothetical protein
MPEIQRFYVGAYYQRASIGHRLLEQAITVARPAGLQAVRLGVWENNGNAIASPAAVHATTIRVRKGDRRASWAATAVSISRQLVRRTTGWNAKKVPIEMRELVVTAF